MSQSDLFDAPLLPGLRVQDAIITAGEEQALITAIHEVELSPFRFQGWLGKRLTTSFGWHYDFDTAEFAPAPPIPDFLLGLRQKVAAFAVLPEELLVQALVIRYDPGAGIDWHRDRPHFEHVIGVSLGMPAEMQFRRRMGSGFLRAQIALPPRGAYAISGEARHDWEHRIAPMAQTRWSVTFRSLSEKGTRLMRSKPNGAA